MVQSVEQVLEERGTRYGVFTGQARIAQSLHIVLRQGMEMAGKNIFDFTPDELEAMNMIVNKIARIYNGDNHYSDSWRDIAGYATLVADRLDNDTQEQKRLADMKEQYERNRNPEQIEANRSCDEGCDCATEPADTEPDSDNRPTGQPELRRMPVRLEVQDGTDTLTSQTQPGIPGTPRQ